MRYMGVVPGSQRSLKESAALVRLINAVRTGSALLRPVQDLFGEFFAVPTEAPVDAANRIVEEMVKTGVQPLTPEQRNQLSREVDLVALDLGPVIVPALGRAPDVETVTGVSAVFISTLVEQDDELGALKRGVDQMRVVVGDARKALQTWQFEAQRRMTIQLFLEFTGANTVDERLQIVMDAATVLDVLEEQLNALRTTLTETAKKDEALQVQLEEVQNDLLMLRTMRDIRQDKPVDEELLNRMGVYYAQRTAQLGKAAQSSKAGKAGKAGANTRRTGR